jgi:excisionase family DNA binding protein
MAVLETELMTPAQAAAVLQIKVSTIRSWVLKKKLSYVKCGGAVRFRDIERFIASRLVLAAEIAVSR